MLTETEIEEIKQNKEEAIELLEAGVELLREAHSKLCEAKRAVKKLECDYDMAGNMEAYVLNYIEDGHDCLVDKVEGYVSDINKYYEDLENGEY